ncbi:hypothetical protein B566_EDAN005587 [Ephemera danica]|nr:hypothetical protein B566_EDAN005587 [Ephemera danica]
MVASTSRQPSRLDGVRCLLCDHDRGGVGVSAGDHGHDGGVSHSQSRHAVHSQLTVHHSVRVTRGRHLARAGLVVLRHGLVPHGALPVLVCVELERLAALHLGGVQFKAITSQCLSLAQFHRELDALDESSHVLRLAQIVGDDGRMVQRVGGLEFDLSSRLGVQHCWEHDDVT